MFFRKIGLPLIVVLSFAFTACDDSLLNALSELNYSSEALAEQDQSSSSQSNDVEYEELADIEDKDLSDNSIQEIRDLITSMNDAQLNLITSKSGLSKKEILEYVDFLDEYESGKTDPSTTYSCSGKLTDDVWSMETTENYGLVTVTTLSEAAFDDATITITNVKSAKLTNSATCIIAMKTGIANRYIDNKDPSIHVQIYCDEENLVRKESYSVDGIDNTLRILIYDQMQNYCQADTPESTL